MGSHYSQCFATRQTIAPGDKCYAIAIRQQSTYDVVSLTDKGKKLKATGISHSAIYPDAYWTTVGNFLEGRYTLNGDIDITENDENFRRLLVFVNLMLKDAAVTAQGDNPSHDHPFNFKEYVKNECPALQQYLTSPNPDELSKEAKTAIFVEMCGAWMHTDDVAFKHRVFYMDQYRRPRPLQFTLMHGKCYDILLKDLKAEYTPEALADKVLAALDKQLEEKAYPPEYFTRPEMRELIKWVGPHAIERTVRQLGEFDSIDYHEDELGFGEFCLAYLEGKTSKAKMCKLLIPIMKDRLVMRMLESSEVKIMPKSIRHEDSKNHIGKSYASLIAEVSETVTKSRKRAPRY